jgi:hypothetical protein
VAAALLLPRVRRAAVNSSVADQARELEIVH